MTGEDRMGEAASRPPAWPGQVTLLSGSMFTLLTGATLSPALPGLRAAFPEIASGEFLSKLVLSTTPLFIALGAPLAGWLLDRWQRRALLIASLLLAAVSGAAGGVMESFPALIATRAVLGLAVGGLLTASTTLIGDLFEGDARTRFLGWQSAAMKLGGLVFFLLGGLLATIGWRVTFLANLLMLLVLPGAIWSLAEPPRRAGRRPAGRGIDRGAALMVCAMAFFSQAVFFVVPTQLPFIITAKLHAAPALVGAALSASTLFGAVTSLAYRQVRARLGFVAIFALSFAATALSFWLVGAAETPAAVFASLALLGLAYGLIVPNLGVWMLARTAPELRGRAVGLMNTAIFAGQFASPILLQPALSAVGPEGSLRLVGWSCFGLAVLLAAALVAGRAHGRSGTAPAG